MGWDRQKQAGDDCGVSGLQRITVAQCERLGTACIIPQYSCTMPNRDMELEPKTKRLVVDLPEKDHATVLNKARKAGLTVSNFVRQACGLPQVRQGVKREPIH